MFVCRMWEFSVGLYMINIWPDSLLFTAIYGVIECASTALFGPIVGKWIDNFTYSKVLHFLFNITYSIFSTSCGLMALISCGHVKYLDSSLSYECLRSVVKTNYKKLNFHLFFKICLIKLLHISPNYIDRFYKFGWYHKMSLSLLLEAL